MSQANGYPDNPILVRIWRGDAVESVHRGAWVLVDVAGRIEAGEGAFRHPVYARSTLKPLQALPLVESGAADRFGFGEPELALSVASHNAESVHVETVERMLRRAGLDSSALRCGAEPPADPEARACLRASGGEPAAVHNNCSGKHAGFLTLARHLGEPIERYLDPTSRVQLHVRRAVGEMCGVEPDAIRTALDGCSAPTFRLPLAALAHAFAKLTNPELVQDLGAERIAACRRLTSAAGHHPVLLAGRHQRIDTDILRVAGGRLFPKVGAEAVYLVGEKGGGRALALKMDDGDKRGMHRCLVALLGRFGMASEAELCALGAWNDEVLRNRAGLEVGREEVVVSGK